MSLGQRYSFDKPLCVLILLAYLIMFAGLWLAAAQRITAERGQTVAAAMRANSNLAIAFEEQTNRTLKAAEQVAAFAREEYLAHSRTLDLGDWIDRGVIRSHIFTIISIVDEHGAIVGSTQHTPPSVNYSDRDFFTTQRSETRDVLYVSKPVMGRVSHEWRIPMSLRITRPDGSFGGVVVIAVEPTYLTDFYRQADLGGGGLLEVTGLDGIMRSRKIGRQASFGTPARDLPWLYRSATASAGNFVDTGEIDGVKRIISYRTLADYSLMVVVGTAYDDVMAPILPRKITYLAMAAGASAVLLLFTIWLMLGLARQRAITQALQASEARLAHAAMHDSLTGLPNRALFLERAERALGTARRHMTLVGILYLDLDGFKEINDRHGHAVGDLLLQQIAQRLERHVRALSEDTVARFGGDEFAMILATLPIQEGGEAIIAQVLDALSQPFDLNGIEARISASIGAALYPLHGQDLQTLLGRADAAMYIAKNAGKNRFRWWRDES
ncbi:MAG: diguanylate cyclase [Castellaniella sp.]|nr:diguanylate cyclase [Castellaniella sp.]